MSNNPHPLGNNFIYNKEYDKEYILEFISTLNIESWSDLPYTKSKSIIKLLEERYLAKSPSSIIENTTTIAVVPIPQDINNPLYVPLYTINEFFSYLETADELILPTVLYPSTSIPFTFVLQENGSWILKMSKSALENKINTCNNIEDYISIMSNVSEVKITKLPNTTGYFISVFPRNTNVWFYKTGNKLIDVLKECLDELIKLRFLN